MSTVATPPAADPLPGLREKLAEPFDPRAVQWKAQSVRNNRAMAVAYVSARTVMDRLDSVIGVENWQDEYTPLPDGSVMCRLRLRIGGRWIAKTDVGSPSEQPDEGDRTKAAFSDALKRAAVKFGVGRYLYRLPRSWVDYDPAKKQIVQVPQLPAWAVPKPKGQQQQQQQPARPPGTPETGSRSAPVSPPPAEAGPVDDAAAFESLLRRKGKNRADALKWLSGQVNRKYRPDAAWPDDVEPLHRKKLVEALEKMPDFSPAKE
jgi:hypothetical protein